MALFNLSNITAALADTKESGVSFAGLAKKWETVQDGKLETRNSLSRDYQNCETISKNI